MAGGFAGSGDRSTCSMPPSWGFCPGDEPAVRHYVKGRQERQLQRNGGPCDGTREVQWEGNPHPLKGMLVMFQETGQVVESSDEWPRTSRGQSRCPLKATGRGLDSHKLGLMVV